jgi:hypothetical protein
MSNFDPKEFRPLRHFCESGLLPYCERQARKLARKGELPAALVGGQWMSTEAMVRSWYYKKLNPAARRLVA